MQIQKKFSTTFPVLRNWPNHPPVLCKESGYCLEVTVRLRPEQEGTKQEQGAGAGSLYSAEGREQSLEGLSWL